MEPDPLKEALFRVIDRLSAEAAYESLFGDDIPESDDEDRLARPIMFDPRFDLGEDAPLVIDDVSRLLGHHGVRVDLKTRVLARGLGEPLVDAETVGDYLGILRKAMPEETL